MPRRNFPCNKQRNTCWKKWVRRVYLKTRTGSPGFGLKKRKNPTYKVIKILFEPSYNFLEVKRVLQTVPWKTPTPRGHFAGEIRTSTMIGCVLTVTSCVLLVRRPFKKAPVQLNHDQRWSQCSLKNCFGDDHRTVPYMTQIETETLVWSDTPHE